MDDVTSYLLAHLSDLHLGRPDDDGYAGLAAALAVLDRLDGLSAVVLTGDLADAGDPAHYRRLAEAFAGLAARDVEVVWAAGNHDDPAMIAATLGEDGDGTPRDRVHRLGGLRIIALDSSERGRGDGELSAAQLAWIEAELAVAAPHGTILAMHHPPLGTRIEGMRTGELVNPASLAAVIRGRDVRAILAGHYHYPLFGAVEGVPVVLSGALSYTIDASRERGPFAGLPGVRSLGLIDISSGRLTASIVPL
ncbi:metallophosphoesterase family protein [Dactylosporangium sp. CA-092794]|uniref:metallophosphoesterase family protein n=1 Tax=Dactylosporangium sp. CA-092794 TaxID=3239929 RepID=UPI003D94D9FF